MGLTVAIVAQGTMGAGTAAMLVAHGARVLTSLEGRSAASASRAGQAGMQPVSDAALVEADIVLSIVPPGEAKAFALRMAPHLSQSSHKPLFVDLNAVSPRTVTDIAAIIEATGAPFADGGIIGGPPKKDAEGPVYYVSGDRARGALFLVDHGLDVRVTAGPIGAASALKMSYAGITKGLTGIGAAMMLAAGRADAGQGLRNELAGSQPALTPWFERQVPGMYAKAYRWVAEMREIADFLKDDAAAAMIFEGLAQFYERLAADEAGRRQEIGSLQAFFAQKPDVG